MYRNYMGKTGIVNTVFTNLFLKPDHAHWFQDLDTECIQCVFGKVWELLVWLTSVVYYSVASL